MFMHVFMHVLIHVLIHLSGVVWFARRSELFSFELEGVGNSVGQHHSSDGGKVRQCSSSSGIVFTLLQEGTDCLLTVY